MTDVATNYHADVLNNSDGPMFVTMSINGQLLGIEVTHVRDVLREQAVTKIPLSPPEIAGSLNLRGRIVTVMDLRCRLGLPPKEDGAKASFVVVEFKHELYSLMVDDVGDVISSELSDLEKIPGNLDQRWREIATNIYKIDGKLIVLVDIESLLTIK